MLLYMIRHGESEANRARRHAGWAQVSLTPLGFEQARAVGRRLEGTAFGKIMASDLKRAVQTCETALPGRDYETMPLLREISVGSLSGKTAAECESVYGPGYAENKALQDFTPYGGENRGMLADRVRRFMDLAEGFTENAVAVFTHEGVMRTALEYVVSSPSLRGKILCGNGCVGVFEFLEGRWRLYAWNI